MTSGGPTRSQVRDLLFESLTPEDHPERLELERYVAGKLGEREHNEVLEHLSLCPSCSRFALSLSVEAPEHAESLTEPSSFDLASFDPSSLDLDRPRTAATRWLVAAAATFLAILAFSGWWNAERRLARLAAASVGEVVLREFRLASIRGDETGVLDLGGAEKVVLLLHLPPVSAGSTFELVLERSTTGVTMWSGSAVADDAATIAVRLPGQKAKDTSETELVIVGDQPSAQWRLRLVP